MYEIFCLNWILVTERISIFIVSYRYVTYFSLCECELFFFFSNEKGKGMFWITEHLLGENEVQNHS